jgi:hypothetical protein
VPELVEALLGRRGQQPPAGARDAGGRDAPPRVAAVVAPERPVEVDLDEDADDAKARRLRRSDVAAPVGGRRVRGVDDERLTGAQAQLEEGRSRARVRSRSIAIRTWVSNQRSR